jgi:phosphatidylinositol alpha-1,6-mannosyltransferase
VTSRALLLAPSRGLGGGVERYVETLEWALAAQGVVHQRVDLRGSGAFAQARMLVEARAILRQQGKVPSRVIVAHRALLPIASLLARERSVRGITVLCHGSDVWGHRSLPRRYMEHHLLRRAAVRVVAVSSFTAGTLGAGCQARVLRPGLSREWFATLVSESSRGQPSDSEIRLLTAFRLAQWRGKGLPELLAAVAALQRPDICLTVCGTGEPSPELEFLVRQHRWCTLRPGVTDRELARELGAADLFVLATRTRGGRRPSGEGFGLVLLEAQIAGTPVVAPACGGSHDAYIDGVTGIAPTDETAESLAKVLGDLLQDPSRLERMGKSAAEWAREAFAPENYAVRAVARLL